MDASNEVIAQQVLDLVKAANASCDLIIDEGKSLSLKARDGDLEEYKVSSSMALGLRVIKDEHVGTAYSEAVDSAALQSVVEQALSNASFAKPEPLEKILPNAATLATDDAVLCPHEETPIEDKIKFILAMEKDLAAMAKVKSVPYNGVQDVSGQRHIYTSAGLNAVSRSRICSAYTYALVEQGDLNVMQGTGQAARLFTALEGNTIINQTYDDCIGLLEGKPVPSKRYDVIFDQECQVDVISVFAMMFSGKSAKDGVNPMRDKVGSIIADTRLTIYDQPENLSGFGYTLFDAEGTAAKKTALVTDGLLQSLVHNSVTAAHFDISTTGHASRGPKSTLGVALHQMEIAAGTDPSNTLYQGEYLLLTDLTGLHSGANPISGNFSFGASGFLCKGGEQIQPVRGITVAGNFYEMLKEIACIGDKQTWNWQRTALMPSIRFSDLAISG
ncbi:MAG: TldD/PmbA family protein [Pseudomonadales bacterium]|nr:TldD/PmbA family protein [Pseudomonadales bacterium]